MDVMPVMRILSEFFINKYLMQVTIKRHLWFLNKAMDSMCFVRGNMSRQETFVSFQ